MMLMQLDNGVLASYQQCHFTPDYWRNYTVIGTEGRIENFGDGDGGRGQGVEPTRPAYRADADEIVTDPAGRGRHGGADSALVAEFLRFVREGGATETSPVAAREAVAAGEAATISLRTESRFIRIPAVSPEIKQYFELQS